MLIERRIRSQHAIQQTYSSSVPLATAALLSLMCQSAVCASAANNCQSVHRPGFLAISDGRLASSNQAARIEVASNIDQRLVSEMARTFVALVQGQNELDMESKRILYRNRRQIYRR